MIKYLILLSTLILVSCTPDKPKVCSEQQAVHDWGGFLWPEDNYNLSVYNSAETDDWDASLEHVIESWNALDTKITLTEVTEQEGADIYLRITSGNWLGLAEIYLIPETGFIERARVSLNPGLLTEYNDVAIDHVLCQEVGHALGLGHIFGDTCMDDCQWTATREERLECLFDPARANPNSHDEDELILKYGMPDIEKCPV
jgi:hypothetical protein